jgi:Tol biopolymer transport system component
VTLVEGAVIGNPSELKWIPPEKVAFSVDGDYLYWVDVVAKSGQEGLSGTIYRAKADGSELTQLAVLTAGVYTFSPDRTKILYSDGNTLWVAGVDGGDSRLLVEQVGGWPPGVWRPFPTP